VQVLRLSQRPRASEDHEEKRQNWTGVDLLGRSGRANQQQNCILNRLQLALASLKPGKTAGPDQIFIKNRIHLCCNLSTSPRRSRAC
jgi:hypothetical protein